MQIPYLPAPGRKLIRVMGGSIGSREEICETSGLPNPMVPCLHQCNGYIKRNLPAWRVQKCIALVDADTVLTSSGPQTTPCLGGQYRVQRRNLRNFGPTLLNGTAFSPMQWLYQNEATGWRVQKCIALVGADTVLTSAGPQTTPFHGSKYRVHGGNLRNFGPTKPHGTAFAPMQWLYQKEATGMESSKMYFPSQ